MIFRGEILFALSLSLLAWPLQGNAQQLGTIPRIGMLSLEVAEYTNSFREELQKLGYLEGHNILLEMLKAGDQYSRLSEIADEFVKLKVNVIVAMGSTATGIAAKATSTIPIVMVAGIDRCGKNSQNRCRSQEVI
jgi:putative tryptophan/tyrosine transport system substrate-binding protein